MDQKGGIPVSYTHLDVYKRQLLHGGPELFYHVGLWQLFQLLARGLVDVFFSRGFSHAGPVSYTHLDVYKRQI